MLTKKHKNLFKLLELEPSEEKEIRALHKKLVMEDLACKDFTKYLERRLHRMWARERRKNTTPYLGD